MTTGTPLPADIERIVNWLFSADFSDCYSSIDLTSFFSNSFLDIRQLQVEKGLATLDILSRVFTLISALEMPPKARIYLLAEMADIEYD
jgi:replication factor C subunit 3/5